MICRSVGRVLLARHSPTATAGGQKNVFGMDVPAAAALLSGSWVERKCPSLGEADDPDDSSCGDDCEGGEDEVQDLHSTNPHLY